MRFLVALSLSITPAVASATTVDLMRAQHTDIGDVTVTDDGKTLTVDIATDEGWAMSELHVAAGCDVDDIPTTKKGNPVPGLFPEGASDICDDDASFSFDLGDLGCEGEVVVAVHAVSVDAIDYEVGDLTAVDGLPEYATIRATTGGSSYLDVAIAGYGSWAGWCVDLGHTIVPGRTYTDVQTISSYSKEADAWVDKPANLDLVNYVLNTDWSFLGARKADIQTAIWRLIDDGTAVDSGASKVIYEAIVKQARAYGEGYEPGEGGVYAVLLVRDANNDGKQEIQVLAIPVDVPLDPVCGEDTETAWAAGTRFVSKGSWATYITHRLGGEK